MKTSSLPARTAFTAVIQELRDFAGFESEPETGGEAVRWRGGEKAQLGDQFGRSISRHGYTAEGEDAEGDESTHNPHLHYHAT